MMSVARWSSARPAVSMTRVLYALKSSFEMLATSAHDFTWTVSPRLAER
jgi:hypothetical protein